MKVGVISDTHGYVERVKLAMEKFFADADLILHSGDVLYHGPNNPNYKGDDYNPKALANMINESKIPFVIARGNGDSEVDQLVLKVPIQAPYAYAFVNGKRIVVNHGHLLPTDKDKDETATHLHADIFITGHIHTTVLERRGNTIFLNPGTVSPYLTNREDKRTSVAVITDDKIQIFDLDTSEVLMSLNI
ncbi:MAG: phosphodiesterase [Selenomonadaceae bacterium]|nr:phosphodiesterase [Selenomonadaceae bacterium]